MIESGGGSENAGGGEEHVEAADASLSVEDYVALRVAIDAAADPAEALASRGLTMPAYVALRQGWLRRSTRDPELVGKLAALMRQARVSAP